MESKKVLLFECLIKKEKEKGASEIEEEKSVDKVYCFWHFVDTRMLYL